MHANLTSSSEASRILGDDFLHGALLGAFVKRMKMRGIILGLLPHIGSPAINNRTLPASSSTVSGPRR